MKSTRLSATAILIATLNTAACFSEGTDKFTWQLGHAATLMYMLSESERRFEYVHSHAGKYWVIAIPGGDSVPDLSARGLPKNSIGSVRKCAGAGEPLVAIIEDEQSECLHPISPAPRDVLVVGKESGEKTTVILRADKMGIFVSALQ